MVGLGTWGVGPKRSRKQLFYDNAKKKPTISKEVSTMDFLFMNKECNGMQYKDAFVMIMLVTPNFSFQQNAPHGGND